MRSHRIDPAILREYDVRGIAGEQLRADDAHALGRAFATRVRRAGGHRVAVGRDGRLTSPAMETALVEGLTAGGCDVIRIGLGPTPMLYYAAATLGVDGGVQVTASHNPAEYNGFKMTLQGRSFFGEDIQDLARLAAAGDWEQGAGDVSDADIADAYVARLMQGHEGGAFRIGWDAGSGAAGPIVEKLCQLLPGEHHLLFTEVDGHFPHHHPDPTVEANLAPLARLVVEKRLDFGLAFDGDGDRIGAVDGRGRPIWGDEILAILAESVLAEHPGAPVIGDVKSTQYLFDRIAQLGGRPVMAKTGHSIIKTRMHELGAPIAGELSGHIFFGAGWYGFDDAQYAAIRLISAVHSKGGSLTALKDAMPVLVTTPEMRFAVPRARMAGVVDEVAARLEAAGAEVNRLDGVRVSTPDGWWLLRASNTQDMLTARAEGRDAAAAERLVAAIDRHLSASGIVRDAD
ncbi:phosphomannomutase [Sphingomonas gellani]|uniref:Phosphomannomutase n=1 Tax=Sphingomonas gellani TaxID=1166340 RepID=A0A1H8H8X1_9SPHN|nr:phosphomannomutase/phosphoglucomutase [Sphingomonas gellani]SEN52626.1 phosphomannomutase [Sphingomonas gellani]